MSTKSPVPIQEPITPGVLITSQPWIQFFNSLEGSSSGGSTVVETIIEQQTSSSSGVSGSYTPVINAENNLSSLSAGNCIYQQVGVVVTVYGQVSVSVPVEDSSASFRLSLPIPTSNTNVAALTGSGILIANNIAVFAVAQMASGFPGDARFTWIGNSTTLATLLYFSFSYLTQ